MTKQRGHDMYRNPGEEQRGRVQVPQIVQPGTGSALAGVETCSLYRLDQLVHQRGHCVARLGSRSWFLG